MGWFQLARTIPLRLNSYNTGTGAQYARRRWLRPAPERSPPPTCSFISNVSPAAPQEFA